MYKNKLSGFNLFLIEFINSKSFDENEISFEAIRASANAYWNSLTKEKRQEYKNQSEDIGFGKVDENLSKIKKKIAEIKEEDKKKEEYAKKRISDYLSDVMESWDTKLLYIGHANYHAKIKKCFYPNEIGLVKFTIDDGVIDTLDVCINSGTLPIGHDFEAKVHSDSTHQLPVNSNYGVTFDEAKKKLNNFLKSEKELFIFTLNGEKNLDIEATSYTFQKICDLEVFVIPLEFLLFRLQMNCKKTNKYSLQSAREILESQNHWEYRDIGCEFHYRIAASKFCSLARAKRWAYHIFQLVMPYQILTLGKHTPEIYD